MSIHDLKSALHTLYVPGVAILIGIAYFVAGVVGDDTRFGVTGLVLMTAVGIAWVVVARYSETVKGLMDRKDERIRGIDKDASLFAGWVLIVAVIGAFIVQVGRGGDTSPFAELGAVAGVAYIGAVIVLWLRR
jgi:hypothetical protein